MTKYVCCLSTLLVHICNVWLYARLYINGMLICLAFSNSFISCASVSVLIWLVSVPVNWYVSGIFLLLTIGWYPIWNMFLHIALLYVTVTVQKCVFFLCLLQLIVLFSWSCFSKHLWISSTASAAHLHNWSLRYCLGVIGVAFMCLLFLLTTHPVIMIHMYDLLLWLWWPLPTTVPWMHHLLA